ncbi:MAG: PAS domain-containing protein [Bacteroidia bacterium]|nr:PAS domain-containing protein [Bacteroidia bacterium]
MDLNDNTPSPVISVLPSSGQNPLSHLEKLFQLALDPACIAGFDGYFKLINPAFSNILGYTPEELLSRPYMDFVHPEDVEDTKTEAAKLTQSVKTIGFVNRYRKKDGNYAHFLWNVVPDPQNHLLYATIRDITLQVRAEERELKTNKTMKLILEGIDAGLWEWNILSGKEWWSEKFFQILEYEPGEIEATYQTFLSLVHPEDYPLVDQAVKDHLLEKKKYDLDIRMKTGKGSYKWVQTSGRAEWNDKGEPVRMFGSILDIDEKKNREIGLQASLEVINEQNRRLMDFAYIISHNMRSHTSNFGMLIGLYDSLPDIHSRTEVFSKIRQTFTNLHETIDYLNKVVHIQSGVQQQRETIAFQNILDRVQKILEPQIEVSKATIQADFSKHSAISSVPAYLESIFYNLISNAIKYRHPRRLPIIRIQTSLEAGKPLLTIADNGVGIDMKLYGKKVFGMYKTFHGNPDAKGLGLFMTKNQVEALGGKIIWESEIGQGSTFKIYF